jgi:prepilin-type N-terminal cleavage/methylation domain-containing protein
MKQRRTTLSIFEQALHKRGFTLIELLLVIGIIGVLSAVAIVAINPGKQLEDARNAERTVYLREQQNAAMQYIISEQQEPAAGIPTGWSSAKAVCRAGITDDACITLDTLVSDYLVALPVDVAEEDVLITGYRVYKDHAGRVSFCSTYVPEDHDGHCSPAFQCTGSPFFAGNGTEENPYQICSCQQLQNIDQHPDQRYLLIADIDCSETASWNSGAGFAPIAIFTGTVDGADHIVTGLTINRPSTSYASPFGRLMGGSINNIHLRNITYATGDRSGGLVGQLFLGDVINTSVTGTLSSNNAAGYIGGIVGHSNGNNNATLQRSWSDVDITSVVTIPGNGGVGGVIGSTNGNIIISDSYALGDLTVTDTSVGGFAGFVQGGTTIARSYAAGNVSTAYSYKSGFAWFSGATSTNNFYDTQTSGLSDASWAQPRTTAAMRQQATFTGWDFSSVWQINEGVGYPTLR